MRRREQLMVNNGAVLLAGLRKSPPKTLVIGDGSPTLDDVVDDAQTAARRLMARRRSSWA